jgi:putative tricarboxylic transport membrane protein
MRWMSVPLVVLHVVVLNSVVAAQPAYDQLRILAPAAPGGGWDQTARVMQQVLQQTGLVRTATVENVPGAAGTIGLARFVGAEHGRGDALMVSGLIMLGAIVTHRSPVRLRDVTPIARLTGEYEAIVVPAASPFQSLQDVIAALRVRPESVSWGGGSAGGSDQILAGLVAAAAGVSPRRVNYIAFSGGGESLSAIVGGQVTVGVNGLAELAAHIDTGAVRALAISSAERLPGLAVPTLREQGIDVVFENWRSVAAPPGMTTADRQRLERLVARMVGSAEWRAALARYRWLDRYLPGDAFTRYVDDEEARVRRILRDLGTGTVETRAWWSAGPYPSFVLAGLTLCAVAALVEARRSRRIQETPRNAAKAFRETASVMTTPAWRSIALIGLALAAYLVLAASAGFVVAAAVLFWLTARAFDSGHPVRDALVAMALSAGAYILFARVLDVALPAGVLEGWM